MDNENTDPYSNDEEAIQDQNEHDNLPEELKLKHSKESSKNFNEVMIDLSFHFRKLNFNRKLT